MVVHNLSTVIWILWADITLSHLCQKYLYLQQVLPKIFFIQSEGKIKIIGRYPYLHWKASLTTVVTLVRKKKNMATMVVALKRTKGRFINSRNQRSKLSQFFLCYFYNILHTSFYTRNFIDSYIDDITYFLV